MRNALILTASLLIAFVVNAQTETTTAAPAAPVTAPVAPTSPVVQPVVPATTGAASTPAQPDLNKVVGKLAGKKNSQEQMGQVIVLGSIINCANKAAGKEATAAFYQEMDAIGKTAEGYCKQGNATEARALLLATFAAKKNDPVVKAALTCYDSQRGMVAALGGPQVAADAEHYARWLRDPEIAKTEMKESDICRNTKKVK